MYLTTKTTQMSGFESNTYSFNHQKTTQKNSASSPNKKYPETVYLCLFCWLFLCKHIEAGMDMPSGFSILQYYRIHVFGI